MAGHAASRDVLVSDSACEAGRSCTTHPPTTGRHHPYGGLGHLFIGCVSKGKVATVASIVKVGMPKYLNQTPWSVHRHFNVICASNAKGLAMPQKTDMETVGERTLV